MKEEKKKHCILQANINILAQKYTAFRYIIYKTLKKFMQQVYFMVVKEKKKEECFLKALFTRISLKNIKSFISF